MKRLAPRWNELLRHQAHTVFQLFSWNRLAAEMFRDRLTPHVISVESDAGAAIIPAAIDRRSRHLELLGEALFDYRDVLQAGDEEVLRMAWQELASLRRTLRVISLGEPVDRGRWSGFSPKWFANAPQVERDRIGEKEFREAHPRLARQLRRLYQQGVVMRSFSGEHSEQLRRVYECKREQFAGPDNLFHDERRREFMIAAASLEESGCEVFTLQDPSEAMVAGLVSFRERDVRRCYTIYFNPAWAQYSPGVTLLYEVTARSLREGLSCDYMTGEYPYKRRLANSKRALYTVDVSAEEFAEIAEQRVTSRAA